MTSIAREFCEIAEAYSRSIAQALLKEIDPAITEERIEEVWGKCLDNPWNAPLILAILKAKGL